MLLSNPQVINYLQSKAEMSVSTYPSIKPEDITNLVVSIPFNLNLFQELNNKLSIIFKNIRNNDNENRKLLDLQALLLSKMTKVEIEKENFS
jgi:type I restriction enzyme S subunit